MNSTQPNGELMMMKLPNTTLAFVKGNPNIAGIIGTILVKRQELVDIIKEADNVLADPKAFENMIESGSIEDLSLFLSEVRKAIENNEVAFKKGMTNEEIEEVTTQAAVSTEVILN